MSTYKSKAMMDQLVSDLKLRLPVLIAAGLTVGFDASGNPYAIVGTNTTGTQSFEVKIKGVAGFGTDILGTAAHVFTPHLLELTLETSGTAHLNYITGANLIKIMGECLKLGVQVDLYQTANTVMFTGAQAQTLEDSFTNQIQYGQMASL